VRSFGKYRLVEHLASGGMADVWRAEMTGAAGVLKEVALKLIRGEHEARSDFVRMFVEEARLASRLTHANVVQVFEFDQIDGRYYLSMELVRGRDLGRVVERAREQGVRLGLARAVYVCAEVAKALAYVHRLADAGQPLGLVHRDVSPQNVLLSFEGEVKLADFGIARAMTRAGFTAPGTLKGKIAYMAPEQASGGGVDARADVFSLGVLLWELCAGRRLFARDSDAATLAAVLEGPPPSPPSAWNEGVPPELDALVLGALEREPARRTGSAGEMGAALAALLLRLARSPEDWDLRGFMQRLWPEGAAGGQASCEATRVRPAPAPAMAGPSLSASDAQGASGGEGKPEEATAVTRTGPAPARSVPRRRKTVVLVVLAAVLALVIVAGAGLLRHRGDGPPVAASTEGVAAGPVPAAMSSEAERAPAAQAAPFAAVPAAPAPAVDPVPRDSSAPKPAAPGDVSRADGAGRPGVLSVRATPWAYVTVDGRAIGETPITLALPPGQYRVRAAHPSFGARERVLVVVAGQPTRWHANLRER